MFSKPLSSIPIPYASLEALRRADFHTIEDLRDLSSEQLSEQTSLTLEQCQFVLSKARGRSSASTSNKTYAGSSTHGLGLNGILTQTAFALLKNAHGSKRLTLCKPVDNLIWKKEILGGTSSSATPNIEEQNTKDTSGLRRGHILELSGPPGCPKERVAVMAVKEAVREGGDIIFVDSQNNTTADKLAEALEDIPDALDHVHYLKCVTLASFMVFLHNLASYLESHENTSLLVLNTFSSLFHAVPPTFKPPQKHALLDTTKQILAKLCISHNLTVIVTTQVATQMHNSDGSPGNFDTATRAVLAPMLADTYIPSGRSYRVLVLPDSQISGIFRLISAPDMKTTGERVEEAYEVVGDDVLPRHRQKT